MRYSTRPRSSAAAGRPLRPSGQNDWFLNLSNQTAPQSGVRAESSEGRRIGSSTNASADSGEPRKRSSVGTSTSEKRKVPLPREPCPAPACAGQPQKVKRSSSARPARPRSAAPTAKAHPEQQAAAFHTKRLQDADAQQVQLLQALKAQCEELKQAANTLSEENTKTKTRLLAMEHELQRRGRLLKLVESLERDGKGITQDVLQKLEEERNTIPVLRRKEQDLQRRIEAKEADVQQLKRHRDFTRIVELQVECASWKREALRLDTLLQNPSPEGNPAARAEMEVHNARVERLQVELRAAEERSQLANDDDREASEEEGKCRQIHQESAAKLKKSEEELQKHESDIESLEQANEGLREIKELQQRKQSLEQELENLQARGRSLAEAPQFGRCAITEAALYGQPPPCEPEDPANLWALRRACLLPCNGEKALLARLAEADSDADGVLALPELVEALRPCRQPLPPDQAAQLLRDRLPTPPGAPEGSVRVLDLLVGLHRLGGQQGPAAPTARSSRLPELRPLRTACLKTGTSAEDLKEQLLSVENSGQVFQLLERLGVPEPHRGLWVEAWLQHGTTGLLMRLPLSEVAPTQDEMIAWRARYQEAVYRNRDVLQQAFELVRADPQSQDLVITEENFMMVCRDTLGVLVPEADIDDLALLASLEGAPSDGPVLVDGGMLLLRN